MNLKPTCMTCDHWHAINASDGYCTQFAKWTYNTQTCEKYELFTIEPIDKLKNPPQPVDKEEWFG